MKARYDIKVRGAASVEPKDSKYITILDRRLRREPEKLIYAMDPKPLPLATPPLGSNLTQEGLLRILREAIQVCNQ